jgi:argininosuccinate lyase
MATLMIRNMTIKTDILQDQKYKYLFSVEVVNQLVLSGVPFRDAYKQVGLDIESGTFGFEGNIHHTHEGSIGNLCTDAISRMMDKVMHSFPLTQVASAEKSLLGK